jgi:tRNA G37 N-methylase TrmD
MKADLSKDFRHEVKVLTLYRDLIETYALTGISGAGSKREPSQSRHRYPFVTLDSTARDDSPYGGVRDGVDAAADFRCVRRQKTKEIPLCFFSAAGRTLTAEIAKEYAQCESNFYCADILKA